MNGEMGVKPATETAGLALTREEAVGRLPGPKSIRLMRMRARHQWTD